MAHPASKALFNEILNSEFGFRLDSNYILSYATYNKITSILKQSGINMIKLSEFVKTRRKGISGKTATILIRSLWKASIHPLKIEVRIHGNRFLCQELDVVGVITGLGSIGKFSIIPKYLGEIIEQPLATTADLIILEPISNERRDAYYIVTLLNTRIGRVISNMLTYGSTGQLHLDVKWLEDIKIPIIDNYRDIIKEMESAIEDYEAKAWRAYFKAMKIVEEHLKPTLIKTTGTSRLVIAKNAERLDGAGLLAIGLLEEIAKHFGKSIKLYNMFEIKSGNVPRSKDYKGISGIPYITIDSIDDSGIVDEEKMAFIPREKYKMSFIKTKNHDILLVKDGIGSLGKVAVTLGEYPVMSGIFILRRKAIEDELLYYIVTILKTWFYRKIMEMMSYGTTGQISLTKRDVKNILIPILDNYKEIGGLFKEFIENLYQANVLKRQAIIELENYILKLLG